MVGVDRIGEVVVGRKLVEEVRSMTAYVEVQEEVRKVDTVLAIVEFVVGMEVGIGIGVDIDHESKVVEAVDQEGREIESWRVDLG